MSVYTYVCMYVCMYFRITVNLSVCMYVSPSICISILTVSTACVYVTVATETKTNINRKETYHSDEVPLRSIFTTDHIPNETELLSKTIELFMKVLVLLACCPRGFI